MSSPTYSPTYSSTDPSVDVQISENLPVLELPAPMIENQRNDQITNEREESREEVNDESGEERIVEESNWNENNQDLIYFFNPNDQEHGWLSMDYPQAILIDGISYPTCIHYILSSLLCNPFKEELLREQDPLKVRNLFSDSFPKCYSVFSKLASKKYPQEESPRFRYIFEAYLLEVQIALRQKYQSDDMKNLLNSLPPNRKLNCLDTNRFLG